MDRIINLMRALVKEQMDLEEYDMALSTSKIMIKYLKNKIKENPSLENHILLAKVFNICGHACEFLYKLYDALDYYLESEELFEKITEMNDSIDLLEDLSSAQITVALTAKELGEDHDFLKEFEKANDTLRKMIKIDQNPYTLLSLSENLTILGIYYEDELVFEEAEKYYKEALDIDLELFKGDLAKEVEEDLSFLFVRYGMILGLLGRIDESIEIFNKSADLLE